MQQENPDFVGPKPNSVLITLAKLLLPLVLQQQQLKVTASDRSVGVIRRHANSNTVVVSNHSDRCDSLVVAALSSQCGQDFSYLAAREIFDRNKGILGWIMQHCGVYSVIRGEPEDIDSKAETISLIVEGERPLIMFPEGDATGQDRVAPLEEDGIENLFEAQGLLLELDYIPKSVVLVPVAINYTMSNGAIEALNDRVRALEFKLGLPYQMSSIQVRILRMVGALVDQLECTFGTLAPTSHLNARLRHVIRHIVNTLAHLYGFKLGSSLTMSEANMLYNVRAGLRRLKTQPLSDSFFSHRLRDENANAGEALLKPLQDLVIL
ncbi:MAG: 1-acyl-sn-glycerol-3-phosphate acyltransferase, partial [Cyanobacteria bacterium]|nr:1-acyl-sn-glycerol-3-phosphate acyltransferase [Cyanobacteriota bacterium]